MIENGVIWFIVTRPLRAFCLLSKVKSESITALQIFFITYLANNYVAVSFIARVSLRSSRTLRWSRFLLQSSRETKKNLSFYCSVLCEGFFFKIMSSWIESVFPTYFQPVSWQHVLKPFFLRYFCSCLRVNVKFVAYKTPNCECCHNRAYLSNSYIYIIVPLVLVVLDFLFYIFVNTIGKIW